ncbi:hypothetical protein AB0L75_43820 [Streptomyces sp. NPDC052101]|uniref:hypothetical protein n=1 Tax=Streptomyces sp. NPDC052101 TaxID=3155763 RepID=UPI00341FA270
MPIEEDFTNTLRSELSSCEPDLFVMLAEGVHRGRRRRRRRTTLLTSVCVLLAGGVAGVMTPLLTHSTGATVRPGKVVAAPQAPPPQAPTPPAAPTASPRELSAWSTEEVMRRLTSLVPPGITVTRGGSPQRPEAFVRYFELDDGHGACWLAVTVQPLVGEQLDQQRRYMLTVTSPLRDGALVYTQQISHQSGVAPYQVAVALRADGMSITMNLSTASYPDRTPVRSAPILSAGQLTAIASSPAWEPGQ